MRILTAASVAGVLLALVRYGGYGVPWTDPAAVSCCCVAVAATVARLLVRRNAGGQRGADLGGRLLLAAWSVAPAALLGSRPVVARGWEFDECGRPFGMHPTALPFPVNPPLSGFVRVCDDAYADRYHALALAVVAAVLVAAGWWLWSRPARPSPVPPAPAPPGRPGGRPAV